MNANELADYLDKCVVGNDNDVYKQAVNMLRKQFDKIADLQTTIKFLEEECKALRIQVTKKVKAK
jgi:hypothetical protein